MLHPKGSTGRPFVGRRVTCDDGTDTDPFEGIVAEYAECVAHLEGETDFSSLNRFWGRSRSGANLKSVGSVVLDFDFFHEGLPYAALSAPEVADMIVAAMLTAGIPHPSLVVSTGRGVQMTWVCDGAKASAWKRVSAVYDALHGPDLASNGVPIRSRRHKPDAESEAFEARMIPLWILFRDCGLDRCVRDAARVVRLVGSINAKSGTMATLLFPSAFQDVTRFRFHALADAILMLSRARMDELRAARAAAQAERPANDNGAPRQARRLPSGYWPTVLADLHKVREHRGGIAKGKRAIWLFLTANGSAHVHGGCPADWAAELASLAGLSEREAVSCLSTLGRRQKRNEAGERDEFEGRDYSTLYNYGAATMVDLLDIMTEEADAAGLRQLVPGGAIARTAAERQADRRLRAGCETRGNAAGDKLVDGLAGLEMRAEGKTLAKISAITGRGRTSLIEAMKEAAAYQVSMQADSVDRADATEDTSAETVRVSSRYIVAEGLREAPATLPAPLSIPDGIRVRRWTRYYSTIETQTGTWSWMVAGDRVVYGTTTAFWTLDTEGVPSAADRALAEAVRADLDFGLTQPRAARTPVSARRPASSRPTGLQARPIPLAPHGKAAVGDQWENNYWRASRGG